MKKENAKCLCGKKDFSAVFTYHEPPPGEIRFKFSSSSPYYREILRCNHCSHFLSVHNMDMSELYRRDYVSSTYGDDGIKKAFEQIISLPPHQSDNAGRVKRIIELATKHFSLSKNGHFRPKVLDVGSGLCVFLHRLKAKTDWPCTALDPDPRAAQHARDVVGVGAICGNFIEIDTLGRYDIITFNKVLEHVEDPVSMLAKSATSLNKNGFIYLELPDGEAASKEGPEREEFFIDHHHIFSRRSAEILGNLSGFTLRHIEQIREPSTKYTFVAFLSPHP